MLRVMLGFFVGYFLGTKAGREKYQELRAAAASIAGSETVQGWVKTGAATLSTLRPGSAPGGGRTAIGTPQLVQLVGELTKRAVTLAVSRRKAA
jgi:hypothetical protein